MPALDPGPGSSLNLDPLPREYSVFRKLLILLLLIVTPLAQAGVARACMMSGGEALQHCSCPYMASMASEHDQSPDAADCCVAVIAVETGPALVAGDAPSYPRLWQSSPNLATAPPIVLASRAIAASLRAPVTDPSPPRRDGRHLYLDTARLRL